jgi:cell division protein FtsB
MGEQDNGPTLQGLAQQSQALERENERMRSENAELRRKVPTLEGSAKSALQYRSGSMLRFSSWRKYR